MHKTRIGWEKKKDAKGCIRMLAEEHKFEIRFYQKLRKRKKNFTKTFYDRYLCISLIRVYTYTVIIEISRLTLFLFFFVSCVVFNHELHCVMHRA